jgi:hypothetical protein
MLNTPTIDAKIAPNIDAFASAITARYPIFKKVIASRLNDFGSSWLKRFELEMSVYFNSDIEAIKRTVEAYCIFSLEAMRLQAKFDRTLSYSASSYGEAVNEVYSNIEYMVNTYLPALLVSHYLWPHHYRQLHWAHDNFISKLRDFDRVRFCDIGIGTGFYSKELLVSLPKALGWGFDISSSSMAHTGQILEKWNVKDRYELCQREFSKPDLEGFNAFISIELLEHLEDPLDFLHQLRAGVEDGAFGFVTAAIDAPNRDHIFLYRDIESIAKQLEIAGFEILNSANFAAYEKTSESETVPQSGCFILRAGN